MAKNLYARNLKEVKADSEFIQYLAEMFTTDEDGNAHPENLVIKSFQNKIGVNFSGDTDPQNNDGYVVKCNQCGSLEILLHEGGSTWETQFCGECGAEFTQIADSKDIEW